MDVQQIVNELDGEIRRLQQARTLLLNLGGNGTGTPGHRKPGRPKGSSLGTSPDTTYDTTSARRRSGISPEGRKRIAEAMRLRWAERKKASARSKPAAKKSKATVKAPATGQ